MLRIHFTDADLARTRMAANPDPLWEIGLSLHRLQTRKGRWAYADWYRSTRAELSEKGLEWPLRELLLPLFPRAAYYPDFLNPAQSSDSLTAGLAAIVDTPPGRVDHDIRRFTATGRAPSWAPRLADRELRKDLACCLKRYYDVAVAPCHDRTQARIDAERSVRGRTVLHGGVEQMLAELGPQMRWQPPVLQVHYPVAERDLRLAGRGLVLVPSYFCWGGPISLADPLLPPVLVYPLCPEVPGPGPAAASLATLLGRTRAQVLRATSAGATTGELARIAGVSASAASQHTTVLRDAGLIISARHAATVLHTLTPLGASLLEQAGHRD